MNGWEKERYCCRGGVVVMPYSAVSKPRTLIIHSAFSVESDAFTNTGGRETAYHSTPARPQVATKSMSQAI